MNTNRHIIHPFQPIINNKCKIIILGSVPSIKTVDGGFPYANPQNRFWNILGEFCKVDFWSLSIEQKKCTLTNNFIALYDAVQECDIFASSDSSVKNIIATNIDKLIEGTNIKKILCNGTLSYKTVISNNQLLGIKCIKLPSTSPANATINYIKLKEIWLQELAKIYDD